MEPEEKPIIIEGSRFIKKVNAKTGEVSYREFKGKTSQALLDQIAKAKQEPKTRKNYNITKKKAIDKGARGAEEPKENKFVKQFNKLVKEEFERRPPGKGKYKSTTDAIFDKEFSKLLRESQKDQAEDLVEEPKARKYYNITKKKNIIKKNVDIPEAIIEEIEIPKNKISLNSKMSKQPTAYNLFFKEHYNSTNGTPQERMKQIAEMYNRHKAGKSLTKKPIQKKVVENITKAKNPYGIMAKASKTADEELQQLLPKKKEQKKERPPGYIPPAILKGMSPELVAKLVKYYKPGRSLADELAEIGGL